MSYLDLFKNGGRASARQLVEHELREQLGSLWEREQLVRSEGIRESAATQRKRHQEISRLTDEVAKARSGAGDALVVTGEPQEERNGPDKKKQALYKEYDGRKIDEREVPGDAAGKTEVWIVDDQADDFDEGNAWPAARALKYRVGAGTDRNGITGNSFRPGHPLQGVGTDVGGQVYEEDLMNLHPEFRNLVSNGFPDFDDARDSWTGLGRDWDFYFLVNDGRKYDLKARNTADGTPSYAAVVIGEWSMNNNRLRRYDDYGNISYGAFGTYTGYTRAKLLERSDENQQGKLDGSGDTPRDAYMIRWGIALYNAGYY